MSTRQIADRLVQLCRDDRAEQAYDELFAADAENLEMPAMAEGPLGNVRGLDAIRAKSKAWSEGIEQVHDSRVGTPIVAGDWFAMTMSVDATFKSRGRVQIEELCVYQVREGRIVREQFFYGS